MVYNEIQRQFAMPEPGQDLADQYTNYTYPYDTACRLAAIKQQIQLRNIDGIIHYVQSFCHRTISDIIFRARLNVPVLTLEGGSDLKINQHLKPASGFYCMLGQSKIVRGKIKGG